MPEQLAFDFMKPEPVDYSARELASNKPVPKDGSHIKLKENGQQEDYIVLTKEERNKGFVRPVRRTYTHLTCYSTTTMSQAIAETYARAPYFYGGTFCTGCRGHFPVGEDGEFIWEDGTKVGT